MNEFQSLISRRLLRFQVSEGATLHRFFSMPLFDLQTSNLLLVCQWNNILFIYLFIYLYICTKCSITDHTMTSKPWVGSTGSMAMFSMCRLHAFEQAIDPKKLRVERWNRIWVMIAFTNWIMRDKAIHPKKLRGERWNRFWVSILHLPTELCSRRLYDALVWSFAFGFL